MHPSILSPRWSSARSLGIVLSAVWALATSLIAQSQTQPAGSALPAPFSNQQPSLNLRQLIISQGLFPSVKSSTALVTGNHAYVGEFRMFAGMVVLSQPDAEGQSLSIQTNAPLFSVLSGMEGLTSTGSHFTLPNLNSRLVLGIQGESTVFAALGATGGEHQTLLTLSQLPEHHHGITSSAGGGAPVDNHQPSIALAYFIKGDGEVRAAAWNYEPEGWLFSDGRALSTVAYPQLFSAIGYTYGGSGGTFNLPDMRGRTPVCMGMGPDGVVRALGERFGSTTLPLTEGNLPSHTHGLPGGGATYSSGNGAAISNYQPSIALNFGIAISSATFPTNGSNPWSAGGLVWGEVRMFAGSTLPSGMVATNGALYPIASYSALFSIIGTIFGGDGRSNFAVPDIRGRAVMSAGGAGIMGAFLGNATVTLNAGNLPAHTHTLLAPPVAFPNAGFEADTYFNWPGYSNSNGARISGWNYTGNSGLNGRTHEPFTNNGVLPEGSQAAFIQSFGSVPSTLSTLVYGLTQGSRYTIRFRTNMRDSYSNPNATWSVGSGGFVPFVASPPVGGANPYYTVSRTFVASGPTAEVTLRNVTQDDSAVLVDQFEIVPASSADVFNVRPWSGDGSANLNQPTTYWAHRFGLGSPAVVNGTAFLPVAGQNPSVFNRFLTSGFTSQSSDMSGFQLDPGSSSLFLAEDSIGGGPATLTLSGLSIGTRYAVSLFFVARDQGTEVTVSTARSAVTFKTDERGPFTGLRLEYTFVATVPTETLSFSAPPGADPFHLCGIALCQPKPDVEVVDQLGQLVVDRTIDFGQVDYGTISSPRLIYLRNAGSGPLLIQYATFNGAPGVFEVSPGIVGSNVAPGATIAIPVTLTGLQGGGTYAQLELGVNDPDLPFVRYDLYGNIAINYALWSAAEFAEQNGDPLVSGPTADPDRDGLQNLLEYACGMDPLSPDASATRLERDGAESRFYVRVNFSVADVVYRVQRSSNLSVWTDVLIASPTENYVAPEITLTIQGSPAEAVMTDSTTTLPQYWRLKVEQP